jgi:MGT family glycosyltransferase
MIEERHEILFTTWEGGGNLGPVIAVARRLAARGHGVRVMSDAASGAAVTAAGLEFLPWRRSLGHAAVVDDWNLPGPEAIIPLLRDHLICGPALAQAEDVRDALRQRAADVVVTSELMFGPMVAAEAAQTRLAILTANVWPYPTVVGLPPFGPGLLPATDDAGRARDEAIHLMVGEVFNGGLEALNMARAAFRLAPLDHALGQLAVADEIFMGVARAFDFAAEAMPSNFHYVGPQLDQGTTGGFVLPWPAENRDPLVLVAFSTTFQNQAPVFQRVLDGLADLPLRVLATLGPTIEAQALAAPANARLCASAPHDQVMARAAAVITHGGHGTVARALLAGLPLLCLPMGRDQVDNTARVVARGAGLTLDAGADPAAIGAALGRLLDEPGFPEAARRLGTEMAREIAQSPLVDEIEALAARRPRRCAVG